MSLTGMCQHLQVLSAPFKIIFLSRIVGTSTTNPFVGSTDGRLSSSKQDTLLDLSRDRTLKALFESPTLYSESTDNQNSDKELSRLAIDFRLVP